MTKRTVKTLKRLQQSNDKTNKMMGGPQSLSSRHTWRRDQKVLRKVQGEYNEQIKKMRKEN